MVKVACDLRESHASALLMLIERIDYETLSACSHTTQETYDMIIALQRLGSAMKDSVYSTAVAGESNGNHLRP